MLELQKDFAYAWQKLWRTLQLGAVVGWLFILIVTVADMRAREVDEATRLKVTRLGFDRGYIFQQVEPEGVTVLPGTWSAAIYHDGKLVCNGFGTWDYTPKIAPVFMTLDQWTGGTCSGMVVGDVYTGNATWRWSDSEGRTRSITERFTFPYEEPAR